MVFQNCGQALDRTVVLRKWHAYGPLGVSVALTEGMCSLSRFTRGRSFKGKNFPVPCPPPLPLHPGDLTVSVSMFVHVGKDQKVSHPSGSSKELLSLARGLGEGGNSSQVKSPLLPQPFGLHV